jgi:two-component sensor histidine kinase
MAADIRVPGDPGDLAREIGEALLRGASQDGLFACDRSAAVSFCDAAAAGFLRMGDEDPRGRPLAELLMGLDDQTLELRFLSALRDDSPIEFVVARPAGRDEWVEVVGLPITSGMVFILRDVTQRERSERSLRRNEHRLRAANETLKVAHQAARAATWEWRTGRPMRWLDITAARALIGLPAAAEDEAVADWRDFVVAEDMERVNESVRALLARDEITFEYRVAAADGRHRWLRSSCAVVERRSDGGPARVVGVTLDVTEPKVAEAKLKREVSERRRAEERQQLLIHELNHRVKNMLATVQSVARQSLGRAGGAGPLADFENRLMALAWAHDILTRERWAGASLTTVLSRTMTPHGAGRVDLKGPDLRISPKMALALAMGVHELATNAVKYGALSVDKGQVEIEWRLEDPDKGKDRSKAARLVLEWRERGGPKVTPPKTLGFGARLLERGLAHELGGEVEIRFLPAGVRCLISAPFDPEPGEPPEVERPTFDEDRAVAH